VAISGPLAAAEIVKIEAIIVGKSGDEVIVPFGSGAELAFQLTDNTQVSQVGGPFNARRKPLALAALILGLKAKAEGVYEQRQVLATKMNFKGDDLEDAQKIQAGMHETKTQAQPNKEELERQNAELLRQEDALEKSSRRT
jgi:hypothetical protein